MGVQVTLTDDQNKAINAFLDFLVNDDNFFIIQGAAGTGKSFLIKYLLETFYAKYKSYCLLLQKEVKKFDIKVTATTNKAVSVVADFLQGVRVNGSDIEVKTIFSLLGLKIQNNLNNGTTNLTFNKNNSYIPDIKSTGIIPLIFIDESSFIGKELQEIIELILVKETNAKVIYIGDQYQLAPIGQAFSAMVDIPCKKVSLNKVIRNGHHILTTGTQFRNTVETGKFTPIIFNNTDVIHVNGPEFKARIEKAFGDPQWDSTHCKILAWKNERVQEYNGYVREYLAYPKIFKTGETVITNEFIHGNNSHFMRSVDSEVTISNMPTHPVNYWGVSGYMVELEGSYTAFMPENYKDAKTLMQKLAKEKDWKKYFEIKETWLDLRAVYASSIHKAQGSTYQTVFLDLSDIGKNWNANDVARLMYVGITRAAKQVVCYGYLPDRYC